MDQITELSPILLTPLKRIELEKGDVFHGLKVSEASFFGFGEAYFTTILYGEIKGWKKHTSMVMNLIVPMGMVRFHIHNEVTSNTESYDIGLESYHRLTIPPGYWVAFEGVSEEYNLILNLASTEHSPAEAESLDLGAFNF